MTRRSRSARPRAGARQVLSTLVAGAVLAAGMATVVVAGAGVASAQQVTIESDKYINVTPGKTVYVGYAFEYVAGASTVVKGTTATLQIACKDSKIIPTQTSITVPIPDASYPAPAPNDGKFVPSGKKNDINTFQANFVVGDYCKGTPIVLGKKGVTALTSDIYSSNSTEKIYFQWHFGSDINSGGADETDDPEVEGSWKKDSVTPEPLEAVGADVTVSKTEASDPVRPGENIVYTITATNNSSVLDATTVVVTDTLDASTTFVSAPGCTRAGVTLTCSVGTLAKKASKTFTVTVSTSANATTDSFTGSGAHSGGYSTTCPTSDVCNKVSINAGTKDTDTTNNAYYQPTNLTKPGMALVKTVSDASGDRVAQLGEVLTYTFTVSNTGSLPLSNVKVSDSKLGLTNADCVASLAVGASTTCPLITAASESYMVTAADINAGSVINTASATASPTTGAAVTSSDSVALPAPAKPALTWSRPWPTAPTPAPSPQPRREPHLRLHRQEHRQRAAEQRDDHRRDGRSGQRFVRHVPRRRRHDHVLDRSHVHRDRRPTSVAGTVSNTATASGTAFGGAGSAQHHREPQLSPPRPPARHSCSPRPLPTRATPTRSDRSARRSTTRFSVTNTGNVPLSGDRRSPTPSSVSTAPPCAATHRARCQTASCTATGSTHVVTADEHRPAGSVANTATARAATAGGRTIVTDADTADHHHARRSRRSRSSKRVADCRDAGAVASNLDETLSYRFVGDQHRQRAAEPTSRSRTSASVSSTPPASQPALAEPLPSVAPTAACVVST